MSSFHSNLYLRQRVRCLFKFPRVFCTLFDRVVTRSMMAGLAEISVKKLNTTGSSSPSACWGGVSMHVPFIQRTNILVLWRKPMQHWNQICIACTKASCYANDSWAKCNLRQVKSVRRFRQCDVRGSREVCRGIASSFNETFSFTPLLSSNILGKYSFYILVWRWCVDQWENSKKKGHHEQRTHQAL